MAFMGVRNLIKFNKSRCKVLLLGQGSLRLGQEVIEDSPAEDDLGVLMDEKRAVSQPCVLIVQRDN